MGLFPIFPHSISLTDRLYESARSKNVQSPSHVVSNHREPNLAIHLSKSLKQQITSVFA